jgi:hypothetical protein
MAFMGFDKLKKKLGKKKGIEDPGALAASIGRKKYGKKKFQKAAAKGEKMKGMKPQFGKGMPSAKGQASALENM